MHLKSCPQMSRTHPCKNRVTRYVSSARNVRMRPEFIPYLLSILFASALNAASGAEYELGPDSFPKDGVPNGEVEGPFVFEGSNVLEGTRRHVWVYLPAERDPDQELALMVFQDGHAYVDLEGQVRVPTVFDNLIAAGDIPRIVGVFVNPGHKGEEEHGADGWKPRSNRSVEYDSLGDAYARFVIDELLPHIEERFGLKISKDPRKRAICGMSSGGICAWTVAWERPDSFGRVLSHIGSFTNIRGGHVYPALIRKTERKPIRVFLQDGSNDLNNAHGSWPIANQQMAAALAFAGYDFKFVFGTGAHSGEHGGAILPESLRWLWREQVEVAPDAKVSTPEWELVGEGYRFTDGACATRNGDIYFSDLPNGSVYHVPAGKTKPEKWLSGGPRISGMHPGEDGKIYAAVQGDGESKEKKIVVIDAATKEMETVATRVNPNDLVVSKAGWVYFTDTGAGTVAKAPSSARGMPRPPVVAGGIAKPNGIALSSKEDRLIVSEYGGNVAWSFEIAEDGTLSSGERLMKLYTPEEGKPSGGDGMTCRGDGRVFITSHAGVQVFAATGARLATLAKPVADKATVSCAIAGGYLYVCAADRVYRTRL